MTLDEAIKHAEEVAKEQEELYLLCPIPSEMCDPNKDCVSLKNGKNKGCIKCAEEHEQLAEWLKDYKRLKEQQPIEDCVSRQAVLEKINDWWGITSISGEPTLCDCIRDLPPVTPTQRWIPVSERLPKENGGYLVTVNQRYITTALWWGIPKYWDNVIAWMPLPEPYKAEMESEE